MMFVNKNNKKKLKSVMMPLTWWCQRSRWTAWTSPMPKNISLNFYVCILMLYEENLSDHVKGVFSDIAW